LIEKFELGDLWIGIHHSSLHWVFARKKGQRRPAEPHPKLSDALPARAATPRVRVAHLSERLLTGERAIWVVAGPLGAVRVCPGIVGPLSRGEVECARNEEERGDEDEGCYGDSHDLIQYYSRIDTEE